MRYVVLTTDYDGTAARHGRVDEATVRALEAVRASGRRLVMVTGRLIDDLLRVFPEVDLFERVVAENGAVTYDPRTRALQALGERPPSEFIQELRRRGVEPLSSGHVIVSTWHPQETAVLEVIRDLGLELQVIFNKGAVMVLPTGINKATGLQAALTELGLSLHNTMGIGDAENDQAFLAACECAVAVRNALDSVKQRADFVTERENGDGVVELAERLVHDDLKSLEPRLTRHEMSIGQTTSGDEVRLPPFGRSILVAGPSASGKTVVTTTFLERLAAQGYQYCAVDPEGDYEGLPGTVALGGSESRPLIDAVLEVLAKPDQSVSVNLFELMLEERPPFFATLLPRLQELRAATGRPHWIVVDEAHHLLPSEWQPARTSVPGELTSLLLVTVHPDHVSTAALALVDTLIAVGRDVKGTVTAFQRARGEAEWITPDDLDDPPPGEAWLQGKGLKPTRFKVYPSSSNQQRHRRKYAEGELGPDRSFYFRGPAGRLNLRAHNLATFAQMAEGVDEETWLHHLRQRDYSSWFQNAIKDPALADEAAAIERQKDLTAADSRARILAAVRQRYTAPA